MPVVEEPADDKKKPDWEFKLTHYPGFRQALDKGEGSVKDKRILCGVWDTACWPEFG